MPTKQHKIMPQKAHPRNKTAKMSLKMPIKNACQNDYKMPILAGICQYLSQAIWQALMKAF